jgi:hypothetical protein
MKRLVFAVVLLLPMGAFAESMWLTSHGRLLPDSAFNLEAFVGTRSAGVGAMQGGLGAELAYFFTDRTVELRAAKAWQLKVGAASASATIGGASYLVPDAFDLGIGPQLGLTLGLGGERFQFDLGLQTGADAFVRGALRFPQRGLVGFSAHLGPVVVGLQARLGVDLEVGGRQAPWKGEAVLWVSSDTAKELSKINDQ